MRNCYSLIKDWYKQILNIDIPDFERDDNWWNTGQNLYIDNFEKAGFVDTDKLEYGVVIFMKIRSSVPNHAAIYIGEDLIIHHLAGRLSCREVYRDVYRNTTVKMVKYANRN